MSTQAITIGIINEKGGVGKTTLTTLLGAGLARRGYKVVVVDTDPQGHVCEALGMDRESGLFDLLVSDKRVGGLLRAAPAAYYLRENETPTGALYVLPGDYRTTSAGHVLTAENKGSAILREKLDPLRNAADFILLDTSPTVTLLMAMVYNAIDAMIVPTETEDFSLDGVGNALARLDVVRKSRPVNLLGIVPTKYRAVTMEHQENLARLLADYDEADLSKVQDLKTALAAYRYERLVWPPVPDATIWPETARFHRSMFCAPASAVVRRTIRSSEALVSRFLARLGVEVAHG